MPIISNIKNGFIWLYQKLVKINDTPHRVALGFGLGFMAGIIPTIGPLTSLFLAYIFRVNKMAALTGCLLTNTWLSLVTFVLAVKMGSLVLGKSWQIVLDQVHALLENFSWAELFDVSILQILMPLAIGYIIVGIFLCLAAYSVIMLFLFLRSKYRDKEPDLKDGLV